MVETLRSRSVALRAVAAHPGPSPWPPSGTPVPSPAPGGVPVRKVLDTLTGWGYDTYMARATAIESEPTAEADPTEESKPTMTKKDFEAIAGAIRDAGAALPDADAMGHDNRQTMVMESMAKSIATVLATTNPRFDRERFLTACVLRP